MKRRLLLLAALFGPAVAVLALDESVPRPRGWIGTAKDLLRRGLDFVM